MSNAWSGDWKSRVVDRARRLGYPNIISAFKANPGVPFGKVFRLLRETETADDIPVAYLQVQAVYFEEAEREGALREAVADSFVRRFREHLKGGWKQGKRLRERRAQCLSQVELPTSLIGRADDFPMQVWQSVNDLNPPDDWCPEDIDDPVIRAVFARVWPVNGAAET